MAKTAKFCLKDQILAFTEFSQNSHYDFLEVGHKTSSYTKNHEYLLWIFEIISQLLGSKMGFKTEGPRGIFILKTVISSPKMPITS